MKRGQIHTKKEEGIYMYHQNIEGFTKNTVKKDIIYQKEARLHTNKSI